jgi:hypothetical protein
MIEACKLNIQISMQIKDGEQIVDVYHMRAYYSLPHYLRGIYLRKTE